MFNLMMVFYLTQSEYWSFECFALPSELVLQFLSESDQTMLNIRGVSPEMAFMFLCYLFGFYLTAFSFFFAAKRAFDLPPLRPNKLVNLLCSQIIIPVMDGRAHQLSSLKLAEMLSHSLFLEVMEGGNLRGNEPGRRCERHRLMRLCVHLNDLRLQPLLVQFPHSFLVERVYLVADEPQHALADLVELAIAEDVGGLHCLELFEAQILLIYKKMQFGLQQPNYTWIIYDQANVERLEDEA